MGPIDLIGHLANLVAVPMLMALIAAVGAKLIWRDVLQGVRWQRLAWPAAFATCAVALAGLAVFGRDGRMVTYGAMVLACALALWWAGFRRPGA
jgi:hypothetical protein